MSKLTNRYIIVKIFVLLKVQCINVEMTINQKNNWKGSNNHCYEQFLWQNIWVLGFFQITIYFNRQNNLKKNDVAPKIFQTIGRMTALRQILLVVLTKRSQLYIFKFQIDMFGNMSIIVLTQIHTMFVHFFGIEMNKHYIYF